MYGVPCQISAKAQLNGPYRIWKIPLVHSYI